MNDIILNEFKKFIEHVRLQYLYAVLKDDSENIKKQSFRLRVVKNVYNILKNYKEKIVSGKQLEKIEGIGKNTVLRIDEIIKTGKLDLNDQKLSKEIKSLKELEQVHGIGFKKAHELVKKYKIGSIEQLKKSNIHLSDQIKLGLKYHGIVKTIIPRGTMDKINNYLKKYDVILAGSYRRGQPTSGDIDVLIFNNNHDILNDKFLIDHLTKIGETVSKYMGYCKFEGEIYRIDIRFFDKSSYASALLYFTGPKELNTFMRRKAKSMNLLLNEYGLYKNKKKIKLNTEEDIFNELGIKYLKPNERNDYRENI